MPPAVILPGFQPPRAGKPYQVRRAGRLADNRNQMLLSMETVLDQLDSQSRYNIEGQMDLFGSQEGGNFADPPLAAAQELPYADLLAMEKEVTGLYLTGHPLKPYEPVYKVLRADRTDRILTSLEEGNGDYRDGGTVRVLGC